MKTLESHEQFKKYIQQENVMMIFSADWCLDCRIIEPILPEIEQSFSRYT